MTKLKPSLEKTGLEPVSTCIQIMWNNAMGKLKLCMEKKTTALSWVIGQLQASSTNVDSSAKSFRRLPWNYVENNDHLPSELAEATSGRVSSSLEHIVFWIQAHLEDLQFSAQSALLLVICPKVVEFWRPPFEQTCPTHCNHLLRLKLAISVGAFTVFTPQYSHHRFHNLRFKVGCSMPFMRDRSNQHFVHPIPEARHFEIAEVLRENVCSCRRFTGGP
jgi:hypothetical protein